MKTTNQLKQDYLYCKQIIRRHSKSFYYSFSRLPKDKANAVFAIYAFCRLADDSVDNVISKEEQIERLEAVERELSLFNEGIPVDKPIWRALHDVFDRYDMDIEPFFDQLKGQRMDIDFQQPATLDQVEKYSYYVAGSVGLMLLPIISSQSTIDLRQQAISLGAAMQLTNILRDIGEDYQEIHRIYLPEQLMIEASYTETDLANGVVNLAFIQIFEKIAHRADELYDDFYKKLDYFDRDSRLPVILSAKVYRGILTSIRNNNYDCFGQENALSAEEMEDIHQALQL
ncbi:phytoene/squalene synthase family protein [Gracilibacillus salinarum]|uniref:Phytoene/squalene synthase family protein n=1 Tax=Gracilibacillus salinarum TaxID=2932255 RepID=A0ABY4GK87_9BACI|nr:phytoene/squalene synthase family protein [Gracilibacillus salinarum]UOQ84776.1 phytoene/squalene synthase family protein [Gracilibacillus salinarum]